MITLKSESRDKNMSEDSERPLVTHVLVQTGRVQVANDAFRDSEQCVLGTVEKKRGKKHHLHAARPVRISAYSSPNNKPTRSYWMEKGRICGKFCVQGSNCNFISAIFAPRGRRLARLRGTAAAPKGNCFLPHPCV